MPIRIEIGLKDGVYDVRAEKLKKKAYQLFNINLDEVWSRTVYKIDAVLSDAEIDEIKSEFADSVIEVAAIDRLPLPDASNWVIEVGFKPGVTDNVGRTAKVALQDIIGRKLQDAEAVYTATQYVFKAVNIRKDKIEFLANELLANTLIQTVAIYPREEWLKLPPDRSVPAIHALPDATVRTFNLNCSDEELVRISREGLLSCSLEEMKSMQRYFADERVKAARIALGLPENPTDVEIECIAQTWSEHCFHKIFNAVIHYYDEEGREEIIDSLFKTYIKNSTKKIAEEIDWLVSVFTDNAGVIKFSKKHHLVYKVETHNSPSALDPYGGAMTGIVGVNRDPMGTGMGANMLCNVWGYCFASPFYDGEVPKGLMHPRRIREGVHQGVIEGGNQSGIPWARGWEFFDERFLGKPLVFCGTVGTLPVLVNGKPSERKEVKKGDKVVMLGGRIGKDGIHGATFSSEELREESPVQAVQIGDPITQKKMYDFLMVARDRGLYRAITDNGAGGLSCSVGEMAKFSGGADIDLAKAPLKYQGLHPWEIFLSEAQERMTLAVPPENENEFFELAARMDVDAATLGEFTDSGVLVVRYQGKVVGRLDMDFLYEGCPRMELKAVWQPKKPIEPAAVPKKHLNDVLLELLADLNICSKEYKSRQYDGEVKGLSVVKPFVGVYSDMPSDATVMRVEYDSNQGIVLAEGVNPFYSDIDTYNMTASVIDEAVRRVVSVGGSFDRIAGLDNFCWPDPVQSEKTPDGEFKLAQLVRACKALYDITTAYKVPCISGKDSMKNDSTRGGKKISIPPTLLFSTIGIIDDVRNAVTMDVKQPYDVVYAVGITKKELGASVFNRYVAKACGQDNNFGGAVPSVDVALAKRIYQAMNKAHKLGLIRSSHTPTKGGLTIALALMAMGGDLGLEIWLNRVPVEGTLDEIDVMFSESNSRFIVTISPENTAQFEDIFGGLPCVEIGNVIEEKKLRILTQAGSALIEIELADMRKAFTETLKGV